MTPDPETAKALYALYHKLVRDQTTTSSDYIAAYPIGWAAAHRAERAEGDQLPPAIDLIKVTYPLSMTHYIDNEDGTYTVTLVDRRMFPAEEITHTSTSVGKAMLMAVTALGLMDRPPMKETQP
jgi:hypothetical protein